MNQENFDKLISAQEEYWCNQVSYLVQNEQIDDSYSMYMEYVVDDINPLDAEYYCAPRIKNYWNKESYQEIISKLF